MTSIYSSDTIFRYKKERIIAKHNNRINGRIRAKSLRVVDSDGDQIGIISKEEALNRAKESGLDLVEISPNADPPVAKIMDWGKYKYKKDKAAKKNRKNSKSPDLKQIRFGLKIGQHDLDVKLRKIREFLEDGDKVKISVYFRGREMAHKDLGYDLLDDVYEKISDVATIDQKPQMAGKYLSMTVRVSNNAKN